MMGTAISYVVIQLSGLMYLHSDPVVQASRESNYAFVALVLCIIFFFGYLAYQWMLSDDNEVTERMRTDIMVGAIDQVKEGTINFHNSYVGNLNQIELTW